MCFIFHCLQIYGTVHTERKATDNLRFTGTPGLLLSMELASCQPCGASSVCGWLLDFWKIYGPLGYGPGDLEIVVRFTAGADGQTGFVALAA